MRESSPKIRVGVLGYTGRMGSMLLDCIREDSDFEVGVCYSRAVAGDARQGNAEFFPPVCFCMDEFVSCNDVLIDFSSPVATSVLMNSLLKEPRPAVVCTTGLSEDQQGMVESVSERVPLLYASNTSLGISVLSRVVRVISKELRSWDIEISELHHNMKKDSPSGTAFSLANSCAVARGLGSESFVFDRASRGPRGKDEIGISSLRGGGVFGRHTVGFYADGEYLELTHNATSRNIFAKGALWASKWLYNNKRFSPGLYSMDDVFC